MPETIERVEGEPVDDQGLPLTWDDDQRLVIEAEPNDRLIIEAPPGCGKTAVACARTAYLIGRQIEPSNIWLISFTRTAVKEIRDRIQKLSNENPAARAVRISTLDSTAWHLNYGFDDTAFEKRFTTYEASIEAALSLITNGEPSFLDYIHRIEHLIIDEAQDLTGIRAKFVFALINTLPSTCGISIFGDPHQAIYGFTSEEDDSSDITLMRMIDDDKTLKFEELALKRNYRAGNPAIAAFFGNVRICMSDGGTQGVEKLSQIRETIAREASRTIEELTSDEILRSSGTLIQFRTRWEALHRSAFLNDEGISHGLRLSGLVQPLVPWLGLLFWDYQADRFSRHEFDERWHGRITPESNVISCGFSAERAWRTMYDIARSGHTDINLRTLRKLASRATPPVELCIPDLTGRGPTIGTIHASKGRQANCVILMMPPSGGDAKTGENINDEEARVLYVGATRARAELNVGKGYFGYPQKCPSGRVFRVHEGRVQVEIGRRDDISSFTLIDRNTGASQEKVLRLQARMVNLAKAAPVKTLFIESQEGARNYQAYPNDNQSVIEAVATLTDHVKRDLWSIAKYIGSGKPRFRIPDRIPNLFVVGIQTICMGEDDSRLHIAHEPFSASGFFLAPIITGFPLIGFPYRKSAR